MMYRYSLLLVYLLSITGLLVQAQNKPFPQAISYPNCIKPNNVTQSAMNASVASYYDYWKSRYLKNNLASLPGGYYVKGDITGSADGYKPLGSSEGHGYGMVITALMAGHDPNAQTIFDGLYKTFRAYHSSVNSNLMGWVVADAKGAQGHFDSATDGDMDIAYSLILAHYQWGSSGNINYLSEAKKMITSGLKAAYVTSSNRLNLGDWDTKTALNTRPSDWMMDHMRAFYQETNDATWNNVINSLYTVYAQFSTAYSPATGLISDFVVKNPPEPAPKNFLNEYPPTDEYNYNACRVPLRIVMDYAMYGNANAYNISNKLVNWIKTKTGGDPSQIKDGYKLNGTVSGTDPEGVFVAPFVAASVISSNNQAFLNSGWNFLKTAKTGYFSDSYSLLCQLFISGNWWIPGNSGPANIPPVVSITAPVNNATFPAPASITITANATDSDGTISKVEFFNGTGKLGEATSSPYTYTWSNVAAGTWSITARATDNSNGATTSSVVNVTVTATAGCDPAKASSDDGNIAANAIDNDLNTRWSATGDGQWIQFCLGTAQSVTGVDIAFYKGDTRKAAFDILTGNDGVNWTTTASGLHSSGTSLAFESFNFTAVTAKYIRIVGHGNNVNAWNSYAEVKIKTAVAKFATAAFTAVNDAPPKESQLQVDAFPNPFSGNVTITWQIKKAGLTNLTVFNVAGQPVAILANGFLPAGTQKVIFNGEKHPSGIYIIKLVQQGSVITKRIVRE
ncbi:putative secreted protein (Por secretion system target) [Chitinophaga niastensis]|uniref:Glucanase n=1 Tax=Chitinophaga niastensis TaxID=536980 RepID=A0A2P8HEW3_CHINA|nr:glycosyl hydrolase family 8 [Chitinophaga niastensis]PSL44756.1 putative secreted protein (Por secretion system target) [Chitinophaga niastensis]